MEEKARKSLSMTWYNPLFHAAIYVNFKALFP